MKALDLFCGAGGMSLGAKLAGIDVIKSVECDNHAVQTYCHNFKKVDVFADIIENFNEDDLNCKPDVVFGGPPCQGYSTSNQKTRTLTNPTNWLFKQFLRIIIFSEPMWVVVENVKGLLETEKRFFFNAIVNGLESCGYKISFAVLNAAEYGIPQKRSRLFVVGNKKGKKFKFPTIQSNVIALSDALSDLPSLENGANIDYLPYNSVEPSGYAKKLRNNCTGCSNHLVTKNALNIIERYKHIPQGGNWEDIPHYLMSNYKDRTRCHTGIYHRLIPSEPSVVIGNYRKNMLIHPYQDRGLSVREAARIQSFPDWFEFKGSIGFQQQQVCNAVPPYLAKVVFSGIIDAT